MDELRLWLALTLLLRAWRRAGRAICAGCGSRACAASCRACAGGRRARASTSSSSSSAGSTSSGSTPRTIRASSGSSCSAATTSGRPSGRCARAGHGSPAPATSSPQPGYLRAPTDLDIRGTALPIGTGKLFLFIQSGLRDARAALGRGQRGVAARHLAAAESGLRALRAEAAAEDPNLVALAAEIAALRARVAAGPG